MDKLFKSTAAKVIGLAVASVLASFIILSTAVLVGLSDEGLYSSSREDLLKRYAENRLFGYSLSSMNTVEEYCGGWDAMNTHDDTADLMASAWKDGFDKVQYDGCDFLVTVDGKKVFRTFKDGTHFRYTANSQHSVNVSDVTVRVYSDGNGTLGIELDMLSKVYDNRNALIIIDFVSIAAFIGLVIFLMIGAGRRPGDDLIHDRRFIDHIPADVYAFLIVCIDCCFIIPIGMLLDMGIDNMSLNTVGILLGGLGTFCFAVVLAWMMSCAVQFKQKRLWSDLLVVRSVKFVLRTLKQVWTGIVKLLQKVSESLPALWKIMVPALVIYGLILISGIICVNPFGSLDSGFFMLFVLASGMLFLTWYLAYYMKEIDEGTQRILGGDPTFEINTEFMRGPLKRHAEDLGSMGRAVDAAVNERMKSERIKTELITNVSHDIKTPLTSIINYTDLLAAEELGSENAREYVEVISRNAQRLKKLAVDVVDASKASTGNVDIKLTDCCLGMMVEQVVGEYSDRLAEKNLTSVMNIPEDDILVSADGRQSWRIFDNMLGNIYKYAQENTRVYIDVICDKNSDNMAYVCFRNISAAELNISADELMERFVRGDSSRNTEGSGLGLSIASNLAKLQGGKMDVSIDGDLFKVKIGFRLA